MFSQAESTIIAILLALFTIMQFLRTSAHSHVTATNVSPPNDTFDASHVKRMPQHSKKLELGDKSRRILPGTCNKTKGNRLEMYTHRDFRDIFSKYWSYSKIETYMHYIVKTYPSVATLKKIGVTYQNRSLYVLNIGYGIKNNNVVFISAGLYAREYSSIMTALYIIVALVECQMFPTSPIHYLDWMILTVTNPDGYEYSRNGPKKRRNWRKNRSPCPEADVCLSYQGCGVDLNKNFPFMFSGIGGSVNPCSNIYTGDKPCSELETKAMVDILTSIQPQLKLFVGIHSYGSVLLYPYSNNKAPNENQDELIRLAKIFTNTTNTGRQREEKYGYGNYADLQNPSSGSAIDYVRGLLKIPYVYILRLRQEIGQIRGFYIEPTRVLPIAAQSFLGIKAMAEDVYLHNPPAKSFLRQKMGYRRRRRNKAGHEGTPSLRLILHIYAFFYVHKILFAFY